MASSFLKGLVTDYGKLGYQLWHRPLKMASLVYEREIGFGEVHHLLIDIQPMNPRRSSTYLFLVPNQRSIKVVRPSSVSRLLVKGKVYVVFPWKSVNMVSDVDFISMSRNGQLIGFCHALPKTESRDFNKTFKANTFYLKLMRRHLCDPSRGKRYGKL